MKNILYALLLIAMVLVGQQSRAQTVNISSLTAAGCPGDTVLVPIQSSAVSNVGAISLSLLYDTSKIRFVEAVDVLPILTSAFTVNASNGSVFVAWFSANPISLPTGTLFNFKFVVNGTSNLQWDVSIPGNCEIANASGIPFSAVFNNGAINSNQIQITSQPNSAIQLNLGQSAQISLGLAGVATNSRWQILQAGNWIDLPADANHANVDQLQLQLNDVTAAMNSNQYRIRIVGSCGDTLFSNPVALSVIIPASSATISLPANSTACAGDTITVPVQHGGLNGLAALSLALNYDPQRLNYIGISGQASALGNDLLVNASGGSVLASWFNVNAVNLTPGNLFEIKFVVFDSDVLSWDLQTPGNCELVDLNSQPFNVTYTGGTVTVVGAVITQQPTSVSTSEGGNAVFSVAAQGATTFQWQQLSGGQYVDLQDGGIFSGVTTTQLSIANVPATLASSRFRVLVFGACATPLASNEVILSVTIPLQSVQISLPALNACTGDTVEVAVGNSAINGLGALSLTLNYETDDLEFLDLTQPNVLLAQTILANAVNGQVKISWYDANGVNLSAGNLFSLRFIVRSTGNLTWDSITPGNAELADVSSQLMNVSFTNGVVNNIGAVITQQPDDIAASVGANVAFNVSAQGATSFQWQQLVGGQFTNLQDGGIFTGVNTAQLSISNVPVTLNNARFRVLVIGSCPTTLVSNEVSLLVSISAQSAQISLPVQSACVGDTVEVAVTGTAINNLGALSLTLNYDNDDLEFIDLVQPNPLLSPTILANAINGQVKISWYDASGVNLTAGNLFSLRFVVGVPGPLVWDSITPGNSELVDVSSQLINVNYANGAITNLGPVITAQPTGVSSNEGGNVVFSVSAQAATAFQWQQLVGGQYVNLQDSGVFSGVTSAQLTISNVPITLANARFRVMVSGNCPSGVISQDAILTVIPAPRQPIVMTAGQAGVCIGQQVVLPVTVDNFVNVSAMSLTLDYDSNLVSLDSVVMNPGFTNNLNVNITGSQLLVFWFDVGVVSLPQGNLMQLYWTTRDSGVATLSWNAGQGANEFADFLANPIPLNVVNGQITISGIPAQIVQQPQSLTVTRRDTFQISAQVSNATAIKWQFLNSQSAWEDVPNALPYAGVNTANLQIINVPLSFNGRQYRMLVQDACGSGLISNTIVLTVQPRPIVVRLSLPELNACAGSQVSVPVMVQDFEEVATFSLRILYNQQQLTFNGVGNRAVPFQSNLSAGAANGRISMSWFSLQPVTIFSGTIFTLNFTVNGSSTLIWDSVSAGSGTIGNLLGNNYGRIFTNGSVTANQVPQLQFPLPASICANAQPIMLSASPAGGVFAGPGVQQGVFNPLLSGQGTQQLVYTFTDSTGCATSISRSITVLPIPSGNAGADQTICLGTNTTLLATGGTSYLWSTGETTASIVVAPSQTTAYSVQIINASGCSVTDTVTVNVFSDPSMNAGPDLAICAGSTVQLQASGALQYFWSPATGLSANNIANPVASPAITTTYIVAGLTSSGCVSLDTIVVTVNPRPQISAGADRIVCNNQAVQLQASGGVNYQWSPSTGLSASNIANPLANPSQTTTYIVVGTDSLGCSSSDTIIVFVPSVNAGANRNICRGGQSTLQAQLIGYPGNLSAVSYSWSPSSGLSATTIANPVASPINTTVYTVTATTPEGCQLQSTVAVIVNPTPVVNAGLDVSIVPGGNVQLAATALGGITPYNIQWSPAAGLSATNVLNPVANPAVTTTYLLTVSGANGCSAVDSVVVTVDPNLLGKNISGRLTYNYITSRPLNSGSVLLSYDGGVTVSNTPIAANGSYLFQNLSDSSYVLTPNTAIAWGGVTSADALIINDYFIDPSLLSGLTEKAADVNNDGAINATDALLTLNRVVGVTNSFPAGNWVYGSDTVILSGADVTRNVAAICVGDVNVSYIPGARRQHELNLEALAVYQQHPSNVQWVNLSLDQDLSLGAFQLGLQLQPGSKLLEVWLEESVIQPVFYQEGDLVRIAWFTASEALELKENHTFLRLKLRNEGFGESGMPFELAGWNELVDRQAQPYTGVTLQTQRWRPLTAAGVLKLKPYPNPASNEFKISYSLPYDGDVILELYDMTGRTLSRLAYDKRSAGVYELDYDATMLAPGMYFIRLTHQAENTQSTINERLIIQK